jgi:hypothetical protein
MILTDERALFLHYNSFVLQIDNGLPRPRSGMPVAWRRSIRDLEASRRAPHGWVSSSCRRAVRHCLALVGQWLAPICVGCGFVGLLLKGHQQHAEILRIDGSYSEETQFTPPWQARDKQLQSKTSLAEGSNQHVRTYYLIIGVIAVHMHHNQRCNNLYCISAHCSYAQHNGALKDHLHEDSMPATSHSDKITLEQQVSVIHVLRYANFVIIQLTSHVMLCMPHLQESQQFDVSLHELNGIQKTSQWSLNGLVPNFMVQQRGHETGAHSTSKAGLPYRPRERDFTRQQQYDKDGVNGLRHSDTTMYTKQAEQRTRLLDHDNNASSDASNDVVEDDINLSSSAEGLTWLDKRIKAILGH